MAQGRFIPTNPGKYRGNLNNIFFRSSWELTVMKFFDKSNGVTAWAAEEVVVPYISPKDGRVHKYFPDFYVELINKNQETEKWIVEVKPLKEAKIEYTKSVYDKVALAVNEAKWNAANKFCITNGLKFKVITEIDIFKMAPQEKGKGKSTRSTRGSKKTASTRKTTTKRKPI